MQAASPDTHNFDDSTDPVELLRWTFATFPSERIVVTTAFGMEGCVLLDMLARLERRIPVTFVDTGFLFPETHALRARLAARYPTLRIESRATDLDPAAQEFLYGPALWTRDPDRCCELRKVEPMRALLRGAAAWITAIRRDQSAARAATRAVSWDRRFEVTKIAPLAAWSRREVLDYVVEHDVPVNELHFRGYPTLGCVQCTRRVEGAGPGDYSRAGRWADGAGGAGGSKTECGLHFAEPPEPLEKELQETIR